MAFICCSCCSHVLHKKCIKVMTVYQTLASFRCLRGFLLGSSYNCSVCQHLMHLCSNKRLVFALQPLTCISTYVWGRLYSGGNFRSLLMRWSRIDGLSIGWRNKSGIFQSGLLSIIRWNFNLYSSRLAQHLTANWKNYCHCTCVSKKMTLSCVMKKSMPVVWFPPLSLISWDWALNT